MDSVKDVALKNGDIINVDVSTIFLDGYYSDSLECSALDNR